MTYALLLLEPASATQPLVVTGMFAAVLTSEAVEHDAEVYVFTGQAEGRVGEGVA